MLARRLVTRQLQSSRRCAATTGLFEVLDRNNKHDTREENRGRCSRLLQLGQYRSFHATRKQEILPVVGALVVFFVARYSWKAMIRMEEEWEEYEWQLQQYERAMAKSTEDRPPTIGIDFGTIYLKLSKVYKQPDPELVITREGDRYRFIGILEQNDDDEGESVIIAGKPALEKFFYKPSTSTAQETVDIVYPKKLAENNHQPKIIQNVVKPALTEVIDILPREINSSVRSVITLPPNRFFDDGETMFANLEGIKEFLPEPVAAIWGAQSMNLLPTPSDPNDESVTLVLDVGGSSTFMSVVQRDTVLSSITLDGIGGESFVEQMVYRILQEAPTQSYDISNDALVLQMIHKQARESVMELTNKTQSKIHIPFIFMGQENPHLDITISRNVVEQAVEDYWREKVYPNYSDSDELSTQMPPPTNLKSLITSAFTNLLEQSNLMPQNINHILMVGGGTRHNLVAQSCKEGIEVITGSNQSNFVLPEPSIRSELTSLGAATLLPNYYYSFDSGLTRVQE